MNINNANNSLKKKINERYKKIDINSNKVKYDRHNNLPIQMQNIQKKRNDKSKKQIKIINTEQDLINNIKINKTAVLNYNHIPNNNNSINKNQNTNKFYNKIDNKKRNNIICSTNNTNNNTINISSINKSKKLKSKNLRSKTSENSYAKSKNDISSFSKRKKYLVPVVKARKKTIENENSKKKVEIENEEENNSKKQIFVSQLLENKQNELIRDYQKYLSDFNQKLIKCNEKKLKFIQSEGYELDELLQDENSENNNSNDSIDEVDNEKDEEENSKEIKTINSNNISSPFEKISIDNNKEEVNDKKKNHEEKEEYNLVLRKKQNIKNKNINNYSDINGNEKITEDTNHNIMSSDKFTNSYINTSNTYRNNQSGIRKPRIDSLEFVFKINSQVDSNRIIDYLSKMETIQEKNNLNNNNNNNIDKENNNINEEENNDSNIIENATNSNFIYKKQNCRTKEEIQEFMKNNKQKIKDKEIQLKTLKDNEKMKKFMNFVQLQKNIEDNLNLINCKNTITNENNISSSSESSLSSSLNQQDFYVNCFEAQKIFSSEDKNIPLIDNNNEVQDEEDINISSGEESHNYINGNKKRKIKNEKKTKRKLNEEDFDKIKSVINKLNSLIDNSVKTMNNKNSKNNNLKLINNNYHNENINNNLKNELADNKDNNDIMPIDSLKNSNSNSNSNQNITNNVITEKDAEYEEENIIPNKSNEMSNFNDNNKDNNQQKALTPDKIKYNFSEEELNNYNEIFTSIFNYLKLITQRNILNDIICYGDLKFRYKIGFEQLILIFKHKPFNILRLLQQREYYQVILKQFYIAYIRRAFNNIKLYVFNTQIFSEANRIINQIYSVIFFKRLFFYIEIKEDFYNDNQTIEEEKSSIRNSEREIVSNENGSHSNSLSKRNEIEEKQKNWDEEDEIEMLHNIFNSLINIIANPLKKFGFHQLYEYSKNIENRNVSLKELNDSKNINIDQIKEENNKKICKIKNNIDNSNNQSLNKDDSIQKNNTYLYESFTEKSSISAYPNSEGNDRLHKLYIMLEDQKSNENYIEQTSENNESINNESNINTSQNQNLNSYSKSYFSDENKSFNNINKNKGIFSSDNINNYESFNTNSNQIRKIKIDNNEDFDSNKKIDIINNNYEMKTPSPKVNKNDKKDLFVKLNNDFNINNKINNNTNNNINNNDILEKNPQNILINKNKLNEDDKNLEQKIKNNNELNKEKIEENDSNNKKEDFGNFIVYRQNPNEKTNNVEQENSNKNIQEPKKNCFFRNDLNNNESPGVEKKDNNFYTKNIPFDLSNSFKIKSSFNNNKRYTISEKETPLIEEKQEFLNDEIFSHISANMENKIKDEIVNEIIDELLNNDLLEKKKHISNKKIEISSLSIASINSTPNKSEKENISICQLSPGRKYNKFMTISGNLINNKSNNSFKFNNKYDNIMNNSIFMQTVDEIKKINSLDYYNKNILPELLKQIKQNISLNYIDIINNLKIPLKIDENQFISDLSSKIIIKDNYKKNWVIKYDIPYINSDINKTKFINEEEIFTNVKEKDENIKILNNCIVDSANEIIKNKRMYGKKGEPFLWSLRNKEIDYRYKQEDFFKNNFINSVIKEIKDNIHLKLGLISENHGNIFSSEFAKEKETKFNQSIFKELKEEKKWEILDEQETMIKLMMSKLIWNQLLNEIVEILEHVQLSRKYPVKYNYKSIYSCEDIPMLNFQNDDSNKVRVIVKKNEEADFVNSH